MSNLANTGKSYFSLIPLEVFEIIITFKITVLEYSNKKPKILKII